MTTQVYIENVLGSGQIVKLREDFGDYSVSRDLRPGEYVRLVISPFKSLSVEEIQIMSDRTAAARAPQIEFGGPVSLARRFGGGRR
jgi:hypothetical protein